ncbi:MAG: mandelate racemase/muconate lactonizing enzyme family protein [Candidatus Poribacteria bacterium]|nr:mandelate racemase/muconate lactonizing enzyme family protein [Candidatus Poribacteria bacterium]
MKIVEMQTFVVGNIPPYRGGRRWLFIKLVTDEGIEGIGEWSTGQVGREASNIQLIQHLVDQFVIGTDPFQIELLWQRIYATDHDYRHPGLSATPALSAIEMACWDIVGKAANQPVYNLLGGAFHEKLWAYAYMPTQGVWESPQKAGEIAAKLLEEGNTAMKFDPFPIFPAPRDIPLKDIMRVAEIFKSIRDAVGNEVEVGLGTHGQLTTSSAIRIAQVLEEYHPFWFEEPVSLENVDEMARVAAHTSIPIATGERLLTKYEFVEIFQKQAAQIIQLDVGHCGGILESKKIAGMAEAHFASIAPHMYCGPVAAAAAVQLATCSPNFLIQEYNVTSLHSDLFTTPIEFKEGYIIPPTGPGLGLEFNEEVLAAHSIEL